MVNWPKQYSNGIAILRKWTNSCVANVSALPFQEDMFSSNPSTVRHKINAVFDSSIPREDSRHVRIEWAL